MRSVNWKPGANPGSITSPVWRVKPIKAHSNINKSRTTGKGRFGTGPR